MKLHLFSDKSHDGWKSGPPNANAGWNDNPGPAPGPIGANHRDGMMGGPNDSAGSGWGGPPSQSRGGPQWGNGPPPNAGRWGGGGGGPPELESPTMPRRFDDNTGTSLWGNKGNQNVPNTSEFS